MSTTTSLRVWYESHVVGRLDAADGGRLVFTYAPTWLSRQDAGAALSASDTSKNLPRGRGRSSVAT